MARIKDLLGKQFDRLTVIEFAGTHRRTNGFKSAKWKCICICGIIRIVHSTDLIQGHTRSCGCIRRKPLGVRPFNQLFSEYKQSAKKRKINWNLTEEEFRYLTKQNCHYCNIEPKQFKNDPTSRKEWNEISKYLYNGIDRIDNTKGYFIENCVTCCKICNFAKGQLTEIEFKEWVQQIYNYWASKL